MRTIAVIGAGWGDEGKGRTVDDIVSAGVAERIAVVRHNSSAQAGHTVVAGGVRHVFSHFGSGTLHGVPTYLGRGFIIEPHVFRREQIELLHLGISSTPLVDPRCLVITPYDRAANQALEASRGDRRHGSCGIGFGLVQQRHLDAPRISIHADDLLAKMGDLSAIRAYYLDTYPGIDQVAGSAASAFLADPSPDMGEWRRDATAFLTGCHMAYPDYFGGTPTIVFEGAQGLLLDRASEFFPHVTRCSTGLTDVVSAASAMHRRDIDVYYVTRCYSTRHGAGPLPGERELNLTGFEDRTNRPNPWQGSLRLAPLNIDLVTAAITKDLAAARARYDHEIRANLVMTCTDHVKPTGLCKAIVYGSEVTMPFGSAAEVIARAIGAETKTFTGGPDRGQTWTVSMQEKEAANAG